MVDLANLTTRSLCAECGILGFKCGNDDIDKWLRKHSLAKHNIYKTRVTTFHEGDNMDVVGFYALSIVLEFAKELNGTFDVRGMAQGGVFPAMHLNYLAVRKQDQDQGLGGIMMSEVLDHFCHLAEVSGVEIMTLVPLDSKVSAFYQRRKFVPYGRGKLLIDARRAIAERDRARSL